MSSIKFKMDDQNNGPFKRGARQTEHLLPQSQVFPRCRNVIILFFFSFYGVRDPNAIYRDNLEHRMCSKIYYVRASLSGYFFPVSSRATGKRRERGESGAGVDFAASSSSPVSSPTPGKKGRVDSAGGCAY